MMRERRETLAAIGLASARTVFCGYCAAHQSITLDEAFTANAYVTGVWSNLWKHHDLKQSHPVPYWHDCPWACSARASLP
jgi:hypothetical protein